MTSFRDKFDRMVEEIEEESNLEIVTDLMSNLCAFADDLLNEWTGLHEEKKELDAILDYFHIATFTLSVQLLPLLFYVPESVKEMWQNYYKEKFTRQAYAVLSVAYNLGKNQGDPLSGLEEVYQEFLEGETANDDQ